MITKFEEIRDNWTLIKNACRTTVRKKFTDNKATDNFKKKLLISEHSPIRLFEVYWKWDGIPYFISTEWSRHRFEKFISSQRNDRQDQYDRNAARQDAPVTFDGFANMQNLIDAWRKRLCCQATKEARELAEDFKVKLHETHPFEANVLVPSCVYRDGCPELTPCGFFNKFLKYFNENHSDKMLTDIQDRYDVYNEMFYSERNN